MNIDILNHIRKIIYRSSDILRKNKTRLANFLQPLNKILYGGGNRKLFVIYDEKNIHF